MGIFTANPFTTAWLGNGNDRPAFLYELILDSGESASLAYFLYRGLEENKTGPLGQMSSMGEEIALAKQALAAMATSPSFSDMSSADINKIANWNVSVPEPSSIALAILGCLSFLGLTGCQKRCRRGKEGDS